MVMLQEIRFLEPNTEMRKRMELIRESPFRKS